MQRRSFLQQAGFVVLGTGGRATTSGAQTREAGLDGQQDGPQRVLITSAYDELAGVVAAALDGQYAVRLTAPSEVTTRYSFTRHSLDRDEALHALVRGQDAIVHVARAPSDASAEAHIDYCTRGTYNLLMAAAEEGVRHVLFLSSLEMLVDYDQGLEVTEDWRPVPSDNPFVLGVYLGEFVCREFARAGRQNIVVLRLGRMVRQDKAARPAQDPLCVERRDVAQAVSKALAASLAGQGALSRPWSVFHIQSRSPLSRFTSERAGRAFGYVPRNLRAVRDEKETENIRVKT